MNSIFKALNDETRRKILELLQERDLTAGKIAEHFNISKPSISHHLETLKQAGLITSIKNGQYINYSINTTIFDEVVAWMLSLKPSKSSFHEIQYKNRMDQLDHNSHSNPISGEHLGEIT